MLKVILWFDCRHEYRKTISAQSRQKIGITGVAREKVITVARQFAENAHKTQGRSMIIIGAAMNHWYHADMNYRGVINLLMLCGCVGQTGGGWAHYVGQEKLRPQTGWTALAFALDWARPPRHMNSTSAWYAHTDQLRYETVRTQEILSPTAPAGDGSKLSLIDFNIRAERMGWLPSAPQLERNPLTLAAEAAQGHRGEVSPILFRVETQGQAKVVSVAEKSTFVVPP